MADRVSQRGNRAGLVAGRDINVTVPNVRTTLSTLVDKYREEASEDQTLTRFIDQLTVFLEPVEDEPAGLERKLELGGRGDQFRRASKMKEGFYKKLSANQLSPAAQEIFAHLLGFIYMRFCGHVKPLVAEGADRRTVDAAVYTQVVEVAHAMLDDNVLSIHAPDIEGMLYYLAANCHVGWHVR